MHQIFNNGISPSQFSELVKNEDHILAYIYTDWCSACKRTSPMFEEVSYLYPNVFFIQINLGESRWMNAKFNLHSIPYLFFIQNQKLTHKTHFEGTKGQLMEIIESRIKNE